MAAQTVRIVQRRSANGSNRIQRETLRSLGLRGIGKSVEKEDGPVVRGMVRVVGHLVEVQPVNGKSSKPRASKSAAKPAEEGDQDG
jgi:large subunit ribosomal protein L30